MELSAGEQQIINQLAALNARDAKRSSLTRLFITGMVYGVGFAIGSAIIATIALGIFGPWFARIPWVRDSFQSGVQILRDR